MRALAWQGTNKLSVCTVADPTILNPHDVIVAVRRSSVCGSDCHIIAGLIPTMLPGDIIGHEFMGEIVDVGPAVRKVQKGQRVCVAPFIGCGSCVHCHHEQHSLCDNSNPNPEVAAAIFGHAPGGIYGYTHALGGYAGCHAEYVRVPFGDENCFPVPDELSDDQALFCSEAWPTGFTGADLCNIKPGDVVAVWGCGGVGLMAQASAFQLGAGRVIAIDSIPERLRMARENVGCETLDYSQVNVHEALLEMTGGRGPDACIEAVGMEAHGKRVDYLIDRAMQMTMTGTDSASSLREAIYACAKGGTVSCLGVFNFTDNFPMGQIVNKGLTLRGAQVFGQRYIPRLLKMAAEGKFDPSFMITHRASLEQSPEAYEMWRKKEDGCVRVIFEPHARR